MATDVSEAVDAYLVGSDAQDDERLAFVIEELRTAHRAFVRSRGLTGDDSRYESLMYLRLIAEVGIRVGWAVEHALDDPGEVHSRIDALRKLDLDQLARAHRAIHSGSPDETLARGLRALMDAIPVGPASRNLEDLATTDALRNLYFVHRLCSSAVHAGAVMPRIDIMPAERAASMTVTMMTIAWGYSAMAVGALTAQGAKAEWDRVGVAAHLRRANALRLD